MFTASGTFSILAGLVLIFLIYVMLAAERRSELGIVRALGMRRSSMVQMFVTEGLAYDLAACVLGLGLGLLVSWAMIDFLTGLLATISRQFRGPEFLFQLEWSVFPSSLVVAFCLGLLLTLVVILVSSVRVSRVSIVTAIRNLPEGTLRRRGHRTRWIALGAMAILLLLPSWWFIDLHLANLNLNLDQEGDGSMNLRWGANLLLGSLAIAVYFGLAWRGAPDRWKQTLPMGLLGAGWLTIWAFPWDRFKMAAGGQPPPGEMLLDQVLTAPLLLLGAILLIQAVAGPTAMLATWFLTGLSKLAPAVRLAVAYSLGNRFRTGTVMFLFATVILSVIVMAYVIKATNTAAAPEAELNANFDIELTTGPLSFFDPITDLETEANEREDFPLSDIELMTSIITDLGKVELLESIPSKSDILGVSPELPPNKPDPDQSTLSDHPPYPGGGSWSISGVDAAYAIQAAELYPLQWRGAEYETDADAWAALGTREDVVILEQWLVQQLWEGDANSQDWWNHGGELDESESESATTLFAGMMEDGPPLRHMTIKLWLPDADAFEPIELQVIGALEDGPMLANSGILVNRGVFSALTARPPTPDAHYIKVREGLTEDEARAVAQAVERSLLSGGLNASLMSDRFTVTQAILRGMLQLFQGFLALGLITGLAGLAVISARTVVERRQQVGMLRAIGMSTAAIAWMFILESSFVALSGILVGTAIGMVTGSELIGAFYTFATDESLGIPWRSILFLAGGTYLFAVAVTALPAWQATRIYPAEALRYE
jgi:putative ABC transport system permease protein